MKIFMKTTRLVLAIMTLFAGHINAGTRSNLQRIVNKSIRLTNALMNYSNSALEWSRR